MKGPYPSSNNETRKFLKRTVVLKALLPASTRIGPPKDTRHLSCWRHRQGMRIGMTANYKISNWWFPFSGNLLGSFNHIPCLSHQQVLSGPDKMVTSTSKRSETSTRPTPQGPASRPSGQPVATTYTNCSAFLRGTFFWVVEREMKGTNCVSVSFFLSFFFLGGGAGSPYFKTLFPSTC